MSSSLITEVLIVENMTCVNCENTIEQELSSKDGIDSVTASYSKGTVTVTYDSAIIKPVHIIEMIEKHDYHVKVKTEPMDEKKSENKSEKKSENKSEYKSENKSEYKTDFTNIAGVGIIFFTVYMVFNRFGLLNIFNVFPTARESMGYGMLFLIGLLTSVHCVAMCGGICLSQCVSKETDGRTKVSRFSSIRPSLLYNLGRVISYTVVGGMVGAIGSVISFTGTMKGIVQILAGIFMVIMGLNMLNVFPWLRKFNPRMPKAFAKMIYSKRGSNSPLYIGLLNGLMPCGPLQAMQLYALSTGSPLKGALSMFLFSVGTFPLMFAFGALSSFLNKKFSGKIMTVSAMLVVVLGVSMFQSGAGLSGLNYPMLPIIKSNSQAEKVAKIKDGVQIVTTNLSSGRYEPFTVQKGIPVKWVIQAESGTINGCNNSIIIPQYNLQKDLNEGDNVIEFTPTKSGVIPFSCWMGMIRSRITVVDDINNIDREVTTEDTNQDGSFDSYPSDDTKYSVNGLDRINNLMDAEIPADELAIAEIKDGIQTVQITYDEKGFTPAVIVVESGYETQWIINGSNVEGDVLLFPYYFAQLEMFKGENQVTFIPDQDFDFFTSDRSYYGYVKVVEDITDIDEEGIRKEISEYDPNAMDYNSGFGGGAGLPSCH